MHQLDENDKNATEGRASRNTMRDGSDPRAQLVP